MAGSRRRCSLLGYYEYLMPGIYDYPVTHSAAATITAYNLSPILACGSSPWSGSCANADYVAGPLGVINYSSDMQSHLALPTIECLQTGLIFTSLGQMSLGYYSDQYSQIEEDLTDNEEYGYEIPQLDICLDHLTSEGNEEQAKECSSDSQSSPNSYSSVEISEQSESGSSSGSGSGSGSRSRSESGSRSGSGDSQEKPKKRRRVSVKRIYKAKQGYIVEEPTSELSEEEPEELPPASRT
ncbi:uncharacterized protein LOC108099442 [Drosophila ficusphila]|uniref:uncharacterized protein LOC108099442 n=1 Tax=Drosophila ficusphila TaxID=30025 RepID=UPI0007E72F62|nr:uncharacterized protein LOC108099442 [Drosophila ficusphila]